MTVSDAGEPVPAMRQRDAGTSSATAASARRIAGAIVRDFASQDWLIVLYLLALIVALLFGRGDNRAACIARVTVDLAAYVSVVALLRARWRRGGIATSFFYRITVLAVFLGSFFQLREILPAVSPGADDARIYAFDLAVFGVEPSVWFDRFVSPVTTGWYAFFYFLYFVTLTVHVLPMLFGQPEGRVLSEFALGVLLSFVIGHILYMVVPGWGPYWYFRGTFEHELGGGPFLDLVHKAVEAGGAQKDIFPSLHTAVPTYLALFGFRHRNLAPFRYSWPVSWFVVSQIIPATMFLRWHYLVDVVAGLILAAMVFVLAHRVSHWESDKRERLGIQPAWMPIVYPWSRVSGD